MISTLVNLLGGYYESSDFAKVEAIAKTIHRAVPGDEVSLKVLGLAYYRTGRIKGRIGSLIEFIVDQTLGQRKSRPVARLWLLFLKKPPGAFPIWLKRGAILGVPYRS